MISIQRNTFRNGDIKLSYLDAGGSGTPVIALHAYWMEAGTWTALADALAPNWRVIALDLRGHGQSDKPADLSWDAFISDLEALLDHLKIVQPTILVGNSIGGTIAFRFAARSPDRVKAMVIEESPAVEKANLDFMRAWDGVFASRVLLEQAIGDRLLWSVEPSIVKVDGGWSLVFSANQLADALPGLDGDFWQDWLGTSCPVLLVLGSESRAVNGLILEEMARRRPNTTLKTFSAGHVVHHDKATEFNDAVGKFLLP